MYKRQIPKGIKRYLFFNFPLGITVVVGGMGRVEVPDESRGGLLSFLGFLIILLLRCSPLAMMCFSLKGRCHGVARRIGGVLPQDTLP